MLRFLAFTAALASPPPAEAGEKSQILSVVGMLEGNVFAATWPEAKLTFTDDPRSEPGRTRRWRAVPGNELNFRSRIERSQITVHGNRATAYVATSGRWYAGIQYTGEQALIYDYHVLHRREGKWRIFSTSRRVVRL